MLKWVGVIFMILSSTQAIGGVHTLPNFSFNSIDGGKIKLDDFKGKVLLITNTASKCGFTGQYEGLQALHDKYQDKGLVVFGVPSADFRQEYQNSEEVKNFCEINFGINFPMSEVTSVVGKDSHPFYEWLLEKYNFKPRWNFNKVLISKNGEVINTFGATVRPTSKKINDAIASLLKN
jgi:glutathione peroxidase